MIETIINKTTIELLDRKISETLGKAHEYINEKSQEIINKNERHKYHLMPEIGWMNDPNGFSVFNDEYHLFYQYHPYSTKWGPMHWGHAKSKDLVIWEYLPAAMAPDQEFDKDGCFSGTAIQIEDKHVLMYTGVRNQKPGTNEEVTQIQCLAIGDGVNYTKIKNNPIISKNQIPEDSIMCDFRDPKIWSKDGMFYSIMGLRDTDGSGKLVLYKSENLTHWDYVGVLDYSRNKVGKMWECPDLFELDGEDVLLMSPQEFEPEGHKHTNGHSTIYFIGNFDYNTAKFEKNSYDEIDYGLDFYAPQTILSPDGRRIMTAWMQCWGRNIPSDKHGWAGAMTLPRELRVVDGKLYQHPIKEIRNYRGESVKYNNVEVNGSVDFDGICGKTIELQVEVDLKNANTFAMKVMKGDSEETIIKYDRESKFLTFDRTNSGGKIEGPNARKVPVELKDNKLSLNIFMDTYSIEMFIQNGEATMTSTVYPKLESQGIEFLSDDVVELNICKWDLTV